MGIDKNIHPGIQYDSALSIDIGLISKILRKNSILVNEGIQI
jgi:hypothetical protein